ncbi:hypothetical protein ACFOLJ_00975 [Rugamonas sp. CCM 8940]|uniref:hypothetical protein n=1 Tax=Rugamonas sp. CCM 8940 TaxID=2765359 RepID=UPI0018F3DD54|nr:hypothetical protein [Rugamonas sp. CCM 8940]MBJ7314304.1 hypothetical protein [Rugamonas sp. CCM 8940]
MRSAFEAWAQRDGHIVRRREDKPEEYLVFETQRRWVIWQAALEHGKTPGGRKTAASKEAVATKAVASARSGLQRAPVIDSDQAAVRNQVLNEVLDAFATLDGETGMEDILKVIQSLKKAKAQGNIDDVVAQPVRPSARQTS